MSVFLCLGEYGIDLSFPLNVQTCMNDFYTITWGRKCNQHKGAHFSFLVYLYCKYVLRIGQTHVTEKLSSDTDREDEAYLTVCLINRLTSLNINQIMTQKCSAMCQINGPIFIPDSPNRLILQNFDLQLLKSWQH